MFAVKSISYNISHLDSLVGKEVCQDWKVQPKPKFHLVEDGVHYLVIVKAREVFFDDDMPPSDLPDVFLDVQRVSFDESRRRFPRAPATYDAFIRSISEFPLLELGRAEEASTPLERSFQIGKLTAFFSYEIQQGISGKRGSDHEISIDLLRKCVQKKQKAIYQRKDTEFYFLDDTSGRVLKMVVRYPEDEPLQENHKSVIILTAFYPQHSYIRHQLAGYSDVRFQSWIKGLPKVRN